MRDWYVRNQDAITWFLIGWLSLAGLNALAESRYIWALFDFVLVYINYKLLSVRFQ
jgi:hypothetical protein